MVRLHHMIYRHFGCNELPSSRYAILHYVRSTIQSRWTHSAPPPPPLHTQVLYNW